MQYFNFYYPNINGLLDVVLEHLYEFGEYDSTAVNAVNQYNDYLREVFSQDDVELNLYEHQTHYPDDFVIYETVKLVEYMKSCGFPLERANYTLLSPTGLVMGCVW